MRRSSSTFDSAHYQSRFIAADPPSVNNHLATHVSSADDRLPDEIDEARPANGSLRVLVVDDDEASREALAGLMRCSGHCVFTAEDGAEALAISARCQPHVVITDVCMPRMSGVELCQRLRQELPARPHAILALTALATETWLDPAPANFDEVFAKPVDFDALAARVDAYARFLRSWR